MPDGRLNLAKRPFVDTRPANMAVGLLLVLVLVLSATSVRTIYRYIDGSRRTREAIAHLRAEIDRTETLRRAKEAALSRVDMADLTTSASDAMALARRRQFSWTRFLTRLEETLPPFVRVASIGLQKDQSGKEVQARDSVGTTAGVDLVLISKDLDGLPKVISAFYASPWFDQPVPHAEEGLDRTNVNGARFILSVRYLEAGKKR